MMDFFKTHYRLKDNPFKLSYSLYKKASIWAGFPELKQKLKNHILMSMETSTPRLVINCGKWGNGKTHAANYFNHETVLGKIANKAGKNPPFSLKITFPTGNNPVKDIFTMIIDQNKIEDLRKNFKNCDKDIEEFISDLSQQKIITRIVKELFIGKSNPSLLRWYLYDTLNPKEISDLRKFSIFRKIESDEERIDILVSLFACLKYRQKIYSSIIIWIDQFENLSMLNNSNVELVNKFIEKLLDNTPGNLLIFLNFTNTKYLNMENLINYLSYPVISRLREKIPFHNPNKKDLTLYLKEMLNQPICRIDKLNPTEYFPFTQNAIEELTKELGAVSLRVYNEAFSTMLELAAMEETEKINAKFIRANIDEINLWKTKN